MLRPAHEAATMPGAWLFALRRYLAVIVLGNLVWEFAQLPLYTIWYESSPQRIAFAAIHCTGGDVLIAGSALVGSLIVVGGNQWPYQRYETVAAVAILSGLAYTIFSEWLNTLGTVAHHSAARLVVGAPAAHCTRTRTRIGRT
jgi:hypothetical protein